jgi:hypothetical protein
VSGRHAGGRPGSRPRGSRSLGRPVVIIGVAFVAVIAITVLIIRAGGSSAGRPVASTGSVSASPRVSRTAAAADPPRTPSPTPSAVLAADPLGTSATEFLSGRQGTVMAAVYDLKTGQTWTLGRGTPQDEASIVKLDILETLLSQQPGGASLSSASQGLAEQMIEDSDNDAATDLWDAVGGAPGIRTYNTAAGLAQTTPSGCVECPGFPWPGWGLTTTVPADQLTLLRQIVQPSRLLSASEQSYVLHLMENVTESQRWGVSGGVPDTATVALKNGWLPLNDADTDWQVNSVGWVSGQGRDYLAAVVTTGNPDEQYGIDTISGLSGLVWQQLG